MKKIALDLDGVVFDSENLFRVYTEIYDVDNKKRDTVKDNRKRRFQDRYDWTIEEITNFYKNNTDNILKTSPIMTGADIVINKLKEKYELIIVTARNDYEMDIAKEALDKLGIGNIPIFSNDHSKIERLLKENVDYIIDDNNDICINAANNGICALYFKNNACDRIDNNNLINVNNWGEVYKYLILNDYGN